MKNELKANKDHLFRHVEFLTSIFPFRNYKNPESLKIAANFIEKELEKTGLSTTRQQWLAHEHTYENIIAFYQPEKTRRFIIGAHYDVFMEQPGADDNASSVAIGTGGHGNPHYHRATDTIETLDFKTMAHAVDSR